MYIVSIGSNSNQTTTYKNKHTYLKNHLKTSHQAARTSSSNTVSSTARKERKGIIRLLSILSVVFVFFVLLFATIVQIHAQSPIPAAPEGREYTITVSSGETLWSIAKESTLKGGIQERVYSIKERNHLRDSMLQPGQELIIPVHNK